MFYLFMICVLKEVVDVCWKVGMEVVDWNCEELDYKKVWEIIVVLYWLDGGKELFGFLDEIGELMLLFIKYIFKE